MPELQAAAGHPHQADLQAPIEESGWAPWK
jgi:hypothetical protein